MLVSYLKTVRKLDNICILSEVGMGEFSEEGFGRKLMELRESQKEIEGLSRYCVHHRQHCRAVVKLWYKHIKSVPAARKLTTMYLANDVVQNSKKKGPEYGKEFGSVMKKVFEQTHRQVDCAVEIVM